jgi:hypothetical protein
MNVLCSSVNLFIGMKQTQILVKTEDIQIFKPSFGLSLLAYSD